MKMILNVLFFVFLFTIVFTVHMNNRVKQAELDSFQAGMSYDLVRATRTMQIVNYELDNLRIIIDAQEREINYLQKRKYPCLLK